MKKVVYFVGHYGGFVLCLLHKCKFYPMDEALFIYVKTYSSDTTNEFMQNLSTRNWKEFGRIVCIDEENFFGKRNEEETLEYLVSFYDKLLENNGFPLQDVNEVVLNVDEFNSMGIYLSYRKDRPMATVIQADPERLTTYVDMYVFNDVPGREWYCNLMRKYRTLEKQSEYISKVLRTYDMEMVIKKVAMRNKREQEEAVSNSRTYEYFDVNEAKRTLSKSQQLEMDAIFNIDDIEIPDDTYDMFLLSANFSAFKRGTTINEFIAANQCILDYSSHGNTVLIKPHPRMDLGAVVWEKAFGKNLYIPGYIPGEYLERKEVNIYTFISTGSTASRYIAGQAKIILNYGRWMAYYYEFIHKMYISLDLALSLNMRRVYAYGIEKEPLLCLLQSNVMLKQFETVEVINSLKNVPEGSFLILRFSEQKRNMRDMQEKIYIDSIKKNVLLCFLNVDNDYEEDAWNTIEFRGKMLEYSIDKEQVKETIFSNLDSESIYLYCENSELRNKAKSYSKFWTLQRTGISMHASCKQKNDGEHESKNCMEDMVTYIAKNLEDTNQLIRTWLSYDNRYIRLITNLKTYFTELKKTEYLVVVSVKDTPGLGMSKVDAEVFNDLGLSTNLHCKHWASYIAVKKGSVLMYEQIDSEHALYYETQIGSSHLAVSSAALHHGNRSSIKINDIEYSMNLRGFNIVVYDVKEDRLIDSVSFDTHVKGFPCHRLNHVVIR